MSVKYDRCMLTWGCQQIDENNKREYWGLSVRDPNVSGEELQTIWDEANEIVEKANKAQKDQAAENQYNLNDDWVKLKQGDQECKYFEW